MHKTPYQGGFQFLLGVRDLDRDSSKLFCVCFGHPVCTYIFLEFFRAVSM